MLARGPSAALVVLALAAAACTSGAGAEPPDTVPDHLPDRDAAVFDWTDSRKIADLGDGWIVARCEGDGPFLCVARNGEPMGGIEAASYELSSFDSYDPAADVEATLRRIAADYAAVFDEDRAIGCGEDYRLRHLEPRSFVLGGTPGLAYGFAGSMPDGSDSELNLQYATIVDDRLLSIVVSAYDEGGCPGPDGIGHFLTTTDLETFVPLLEEALHVSPLPSITDRKSVV